MCDFGVRFHVITGGHVAMEITFSQPWVVVSSETCSRGPASFHTSLERLKFPKNLNSPGNEKSLVDGEDFF